MCFGWNPRRVGARSGGGAGAELEGELGVQLGLFVGGQVGSHAGSAILPPAGVAGIGLLATEGHAGQMESGEHGADARAVGHVGRHFGSAGQPGDQHRRLAREAAEVFVVAVGDGRRDRQAVARQMGHQVKVEGQLGTGHRFEQGQHVAAEAGRDEKVAVLHAGRDALQGIQAADGVVPQPGGEVGVGDGGKDGHGS